MKKNNLAFGLNPEEFSMLYKSCAGFNNDINKNHPNHDIGESFIDFLEKGCNLLIEEHSDIITDLI